MEIHNFEIKKDIENCTNSDVEKSKEYLNELIKTHGFGSKVQNSIEIIIRENNILIDILKKLTNR